MKVLIIGDTHEPFTKEGYWEWCYDIGQTHNVDFEVQIGDLTDQYVFSHFSKHPQAMNLSDEIGKLKDKLKLVHGMFPRMVITKGNHDERLWDRALEVGIPSDLLITFQEFIGIDWKVVNELEIDDVLYKHKPSRGGKTPSILTAKEEFMSTVNGHLHTIGALNFHTTRKGSVFGMTVGCGIDTTSYAVEYAKESVQHYFHGCGVVEDGVPYLYEWKGGMK